MIIDATGALDRIDFAKAGGIVPVIAQHAHTGEVLMLAYASRDALDRTVRERRMWYWSRSRAELWCKGATSGNTQHLVSLHFDCDADAVLARVIPAGPSCHTGDWSCFDAPPTLAGLDAVIAARAAAPDSGGYTRRLLDDANLRLKKLGEEAVELALACERGDSGRAAEEAADLLYHALVACHAAGTTAAAVLAALDARRGVSGAGVAPAGGGTASAG
jgi:phosphoribosyl-AMP cyclohydrolase / phosphoribosyl-ATP pyrophosphohydrolase